MLSKKSGIVTEIMNYIFDFLVKYPIVAFAAVIVVGGLFMGWITNWENVGGHGMTPQEIRMEKYEYEAENQNIQRYVRNQEVLERTKVELVK